MYDEPLAIRRERYQAGLLIRVATCLIFVAVFGVIATLVPQQARHSFIAPSIALILLALINYPFWVLGEAKQFPLQHFYAHWVIDLVMLTTILHALGGIDLPCGFGGYLIMIVTSAVFLSRVASIIVATGSTIAFDTLVFCEHVGIVSHQVGVWDHHYSVPAQVVIVLASNVFFYLFAFLVGALSNALKAVSGELAEARDRLDEQNHTLEDQVRTRTLALEQKTTEIEEFVQIVTHDLKNESVGIVELSRRLEEVDAARLSERGRRYAAHLRTDTRRLNEMLTQLLALFKVDDTTGKMHRVDVHKLASGLVEVNSRRLSEKGITVLVRELPVIQVDELQFQHVLSNLLDNAIKYCGDKPRATIEIRWIEEGSRHRIEVEDNGIGVAQRQQQRIFQLYHRGTDQLVNGVTQSGAGMGLAISKRIVERWGGEIGVKSRIGVGSIFFFTVPGVRSQGTDEHG